MVRMCASHSTGDPKSTGVSSTVDATRTVGCTSRTQRARVSTDIDSTDDPITSTVTESAARTAERIRWSWPACSG